MDLVNNMEYRSSPDDRARILEETPRFRESELHLFDAHCHLQISGDDDGIDSIVSTHCIALMATRPDDWDRTLDICKRHPDRCF